MNSFYRNIYVFIGSMLLVWFQNNGYCQVFRSYDDYVSEVINHHYENDYILTFKFSFKDTQGYVVDDARDIIDYLNKHHLSINKVKKTILKNQALKIDSSLFFTFKNDESIVFESDKTSFFESPDNVFNKYISAKTHFIKSEYNQVDSYNLQYSLCVYFFRNKILISRDDESGSPVFRYPPEKIK